MFWRGCFHFNIEVGGSGEGVVVVVVVEVVVVVVVPLAKITPNCSVNRTLGSLRFTA